MAVEKLFDELERYDSDERAETFNNLKRADFWRSLQSAEAMDDSTTISKRRTQKSAVPGSPEVPRRRDGSQKRKIKNCALDLRSKTLPERVGGGVRDGRTETVSGILVTGKLKRAVTRNNQETLGFALRTCLNS
jgi:hypothetical protein